MADLVCCDTSFLFSLYGQDANTRRALILANRLGEPVTLTAFTEFEFLNALHLAVFRKVLSPTSRTTLQVAFEADLAAGRLVMEHCNLAQAIAEAKRLSSIHTEKGGYRSFDILHVAAALLLSAKTFFTFDENQRRLANAVGLKCPA